jgi:dCTP diphosphatase
MNDSITTIQELKEKFKKLVDDRDWAQFHSPKNIVMDIAIESAELMEKFLWYDCQESYQIAQSHIKEDIADEVADIFTSLLNFCEVTNIDLATATINKMKKIEAKYPIEKAKGQRKKYTEL